MAACAPVPSCCQCSAAAAGGLTCSAGSLCIGPGHGIDAATSSSSSANSSSPSFMSALRCLCHNTKGRSFRQYGARSVSSCLCAGLCCVVCQYVTFASSRLHPASTAGCTWLHSALVQFSHVPCGFCRTLNILLHSSSNPRPHLAVRSLRALVLLCVVVRAWGGCAEAHRIRARQPPSILLSVQIVTAIIHSREDRSIAALRTTAWPSHLSSAWRHVTASGVAHVLSCCSAHASSHGGPQGIVWILW
jgi:hypothetical protein